MRRVLAALWLLACLPACAFHLQGLSAGLWHESRADPPRPLPPPAPVVTTTTTTAVVAAPAPAPAPGPSSTVLVNLTRILMCMGKSDAEVLDALREAGVGAEATMYVLVAQNDLCADGHPPRIR